MNMWQFLDPGIFKTKNFYMELLPKMSPQMLRKKLL